MACPDSLINDKLALTFPMWNASLGIADVEFSTRKAGFSV